MKPPPFEYAAPTSVDEALEALAEAGEGAKVLAGGQSLIPLLNMRLAAPTALVDINGVTDFEQVTVADGQVRVGATVRHAELEHHAEAEHACPLLRQALQLVAHPVIRNRGTVCGSIAHADPAGELTTALALLDGSVEVKSAEDVASQRRWVSAADFFHGPLESDLHAGELVTSVSFSVMAPTAGSAFVELARRHGDYALCGVAAMVVLDDDGRIARARTGYLGVHDVPLVLDVGPELVGTAPGGADWQPTAERAASEIEPGTDLHATADYRRHLTRVLTVRALRAAAEHAKARSQS